MADRYRVIPNIGETFEADADEVELNPESNRITLWLDGIMVASIAGGSFHKI